MNRTLRHLIRHLTPAATTLLALACSSSSREAPQDAETTPSIGYLASPTENVGIARSYPTALTATRERSPQRPGSVRADDSTSKMLIRSGEAVVRVDSLEPAMEAVRRLADALGGRLGNVTVNGGARQVRSAVLELRIPATRFDEALVGLVPLGTLEHSATTVEDVGEEFVDVSARVANARRLESRLISLLATRTGKLEDVLAVERELARVREEIERHEGRIRYLGTRVTTSSFTVTLREKAPLAGFDPGRSVIGEAFVGAWRNFVRLVAVLIESLGVLVPLVVLVWAARQILRARRRRQDG